ncbi:hypothetical protein FANTH_4972 [Fusarium anthophilum]|uniref:Major facilitator superfamily (MFS) profile domain-containing protein n=1 Tax=Fusarium anthophilum TaxID=48485 RepID=A0A8H5E767_9HYPO|nr:hypothetical protein FANTH_4972 [Fusarium anthophilum]
MTSKDPLASSADSQLTANSPQTADNGISQNNGLIEKSYIDQALNADIPAETPTVERKVDAPNGVSAGLAVRQQGSPYEWFKMCELIKSTGIGVFQEYYQNELLSSYSSSTISWIPSLQIFFMLAMGPIVGAIYDRHGPHQLLIAGTILHVFGIMMTSISTKYWQIMLAQGVCSALGVAAIFQPALNAIHGWFSTKVGVAFGIVAGGSSIGGVILPIMVTHMIKEVGFGWAMRTCGFLLLALLVIANLTIRAFRPPRPTNPTRADLLRPFQEPAFIMLTLGFLLFTFGVYVPITYLPVQALSTNMDPDLVQYLVPILNAASFFGRVSSGFLGDQIGRYNVFILVGFLTSLWTLALWIPVHSSASIISYATLFGFCSGAYMSLIAPLIGQISPIPEIGFRSGLLFCVASIGGLTTNPINGAISTGPSGLTGIKIFSGVFCFAGTCLIMASRIYRVGWNPATKF